MVFPLNSAFLSLIALTAFDVLSVYASEGLDKCVSLEADTFDAALAADNVFVMFYAPWCGHCKKLKPTWNEFAEKMNVEGTSTKIGAVDCTVHSDLCSKHGVRGYPTLKFFKKGESEGLKYQKGRDIPSFEKFVKSTLDPSSVEAEPEIQPCPMPNADKGLLELQDCNFQEGIKTGYSFVKFYAPWCGHCKKMAPTWTELAQNLETVENVKIIKLDCTTHRASCEKYEVQGFPTLVLFQDNKVLEKYRGGRELAHLTSFLDKKVNGTAEPFAEDAKKEAAKEDQEKKECEKPVRGQNGLWEIEGCQFEDHINSGDAFVKFYAPWCGHCKRLAPVWDQLAESYKENDKVKITKVDCTKHKDTCQVYKVRGYPTLLYFKNGKAGQYSGPRELDLLKSHVENKLGIATASKDEL